MSLVTFVDDEEMTFERSAFVVAGWFALILLVGFFVAYFAI